METLNRFNTDGTRDVEFVRPTLVYDELFYSFALQADGKIIVSGYFRTIGDISRHGVARLNTDGTVDLSFDPGLITGGLTVAVLPDGGILTDRTFVHSDGKSRVSMIRLFGSPHTWSPLEQWKLGFGMSPLAADQTDVDSDGMSVLMEYALGGNPLVADSHLSPSAAVTPGALTLSYNRLRPDVSYLVETSTDLVHWTTTAVDQGGSGSSVTASAPTAGAIQRFLRLSVRRP